MDYDGIVRLENVESQKVINNMTANLGGGISKFTVPGSSTPAPYILKLNKNFWNEKQTCIKKSYLLHKLKDTKS